MPVSADLAVYVHWPFCESRCPYCDFNAHVRDSIDQPRWQAAYVAEVDRATDRAQEEDGLRPVTSVFFGGGTPSLMEPDTAAAILNRIGERFGLAAGAEVTLEANPSSAETARFRALSDSGVGRLSLGVQSFDDEALRFLGRVHDARAARTALEAALAIFPRVSFDLIYARPGQSERAWRAELAAAIGWGTAHLSLYQLTLERGTRFWEAARRGELSLPAGDDAAALYEATQELCAAAGLGAYEVSNHARPGAESRHNLAYWRSEDWIGIGPGAHGRRTVGVARLATVAVRSPEAWLDAVERSRSGEESEDALSAPESLEEFVLMGLRLTEGLRDRRFRARFGTGMDEAFGPALVSLTAEGLLERADGRVAATRRGRLVLDGLAARLLESVVVPAPA